MKKVKSLVEQYKDKVIGIEKGNRGFGVDVTFKDRTGPRSAHISGPLFRNGKFDGEIELITYQGLLYDANDGALGQATAETARAFMASYTE